MMQFTEARIVLHTLIIRILATSVRYSLLLFFVSYIVSLVELGWLTSLMWRRKRRWGINCESRPWKHDAGSEGTKRRSDSVGLSCQCEMSVVYASYYNTFDSDTASCSLSTFYWVSAWCLRHCYAHDSHLCVNKLMSFSTRPEQNNNYFSRAKLNQQTDGNSFLVPAACEWRSTTRNLTPRVKCIWLTLSILLSTSIFQLSCSVMSLLCVSPPIIAKWYPVVVVSWTMYIILGLYGLRVPLPVYYYYLTKSSGRGDSSVSQDIHYRRSRLHS